MEKKHKILLIVASLAVVIFVVGVGVVAFLTFVLYAEAEFDAALGAEAAEREKPAVHYQPDCSDAGPSCAAWVRFRRLHPYPYQTLAVEPLSEDSVALVISEPAPAVNREELQALIEAAFGEDLLRLQSLRWMIGIDGWVEDLVLEVRRPPSVEPVSTAGVVDALLEDDLFHDRIALLHLALFGTTYGGDLELIRDDVSTPMLAASTNLQVTARELREWVLDPELRWHPIDRETAPQRSWAEIREIGVSGAFSSSDNNLVLLTFPTSRLAELRSNPDLLETLRADFRRFAVASDLVLGALWERDGQAAMIARLRINPPLALPPLRFETFALLASQWDDELHQSYERNSTFAGKLRNGAHRFRDWAPIYLSASLINTELGALLNITDQILKSWSEAGHIEYVYFDYPLKPENFTFGDQALSDIVNTISRDEEGEHSVLFNWNTAGSAAAVEFPDITVLASTQTGALPVTYGSDLAAGGAIETGHLVEYETKAYDYFAQLNDPNLTRVVQYTLIYQMFRAIAADVGEASIPAPSSVAGDARAKSDEFLVAETEQLLKSIGRRNEIRARTAALSKQYPGIDERSFARIVAAPRTLHLEAIAEAERLEALRLHHNALVDELQSEVEEFNASIDALHRKAERGQMSRLDLERSEKRLDERRRQIDEKDQEIDRLASQLGAGRQDLDGLWAASELASEIGPLLQEEAREQSWDIESVFSGFVERNAAEPAGAIKTPSAVLSWDRAGILFGVGGHNLDSRSLRIEPSPGVQGFRLVETESGPILRYNPSKANEVAEQAARLAREVEHGGLRDAQKLAGLIDSDIRLRPRPRALDMPADGIAAGRNIRKEGPQAWSGRIGKRIYSTQADLVKDLRSLAETNTCCTFVARGQKDTFVARLDPQPPPGGRVVEVRDTGSLRSHLAEISRGNGGKPVIFLNSPRQYVEALSTGLMESATAPKAKSLLPIAQWLGRKSKPKMVENSASMLFTDPVNRGVTFEGVALQNGKPMSFRGKLLALLGRPQSLIQVRGIEPLNITAMLSKVGWDAKVDGEPAAVALTFGSQRSLDVNVFAGFAPSDLAQGQQQLLRVANPQRVQGSSSGTILDQLANLKRELLAVAGPKLKRLLYVVRDNENEIIFSHLEEVLIAELSPV